MIQKDQWCNDADTTEDVQQKDPEPCTDDPPGWHGRKEQNAKTGKDHDVIDVIDMLLNMPMKRGKIDLYMCRCRSMFARINAHLTDDTDDVRLADVIKMHVRSPCTLQKNQKMYEQRAVQQKMYLAGAPTKRKMDMYKKTTIEETWMVDWLRPGVKTPVHHKNGTIIQRYPSHLPVFRFLSRPARRPIYRRYRRASWHTR